MIHSRPLQLSHSSLCRVLCLATGPRVCYNLGLGCDNGMVETPFPKLAACRRPRRERCVSRTGLITSPFVLPPAVACCEQPSLVQNRFYADTRYDADVRGFCKDNVSRGSLQCWLPNPSLFFRMASSMACFPHGANRSDPTHCWTCAACSNFMFRLAAASPLLPRSPWSLCTSW